MARKPFKPVPLSAVRNPPRRKRDSGRWFAWTMVALPLAAFSAVFLTDGPPPAGALELPQAAVSDGESARFGRCSGPVRVNCVVDGDTFWYRHEKIRLADINAPEVSDPACPREAALGERATGRLLALLNQGPFTLEPDPSDPSRDRDSYGRLLRTVTRDGASLGEALVREGLAEEWRGYRGNWC